MDIAKLYKTQISLSEWFDRIGHPKTEQLRNEDNEKRERLKVLHQLIGLKYDAPHQFTANDLVKQPSIFKKFLADHGEELCALRLIPLKPELPKLRMRGKTINQAMKWFREQGINPADYRADFMPHSKRSTWATIFIVNAHGIFGEIIKGGHHQLTQGFQDEGDPITFAYDFNRWQLQPENENALLHLQETIPCLRVTNPDVQQKVTDALGATFQSNYLCGYFETAASEEFGTWFVDYCQTLGDFYKDFVMTHIAVTADVSGLSVCGGQAKGKIHVVSPEHIQQGNFKSGEILVCEMTTPDYIHLMTHAGAIITDFGGLLSHAAIISRELGVPCIVGTKNATKILKDGDLVEVDANKGIVRKLSG